MKCAIYARVSTKDKGQDVENQLIELRRYVQARGWTAVEYVDHESGKHSDRQAFRQMFEAAARREFDVVLVWALDRLTREGVGKTFAHLDRLAHHGVKFESYQEPFFATTGPFGDGLIALFACVAKMERLRISERTKAGVARARAEGKKCGRPAKVFRRDEAKRMKAEGQSFRQIARALQVSVGTLQRTFKNA
jgi:DNA invertase Pin-like site-specific DNA recombinase